MNNVLDPNEVEALLRGIAGGELETETGADADSDVTPFDLANQDKIIRGRMPVLEIINNRFARLCTNALTNLVRKRVELNPLSIDMAKFGEFMRSIPLPSCINIFKMDPLHGNALMVVNAQMVFALVENSFGGAGNTPRMEGREFTRIEQALIAKVVKIALEQMEDAWRPISELRMELLRSENNPQFASIVPPSDLVMVATFEVEMDSARGVINICLPYSTVEPLRGKLSANYQTERLDVDHAWLARLKDRLLETPVELKVHIGSAQITGNQLLRLQSGDIIMLNTDVEALLSCTVAGVPKYWGIPGSVKSNKAFQVVRCEEPLF